MIPTMMSEFAKAVFAEPELAQALQAINDPEEFDAAVLRHANAREIALSHADLQLERQRLQRQWLERWL